MPTTPEDLLYKHLLEDPGLYKVALGGGEPSGIRDQIRKTVDLIGAACTVGQLKPGDYLIVIGAGVAGVAAAWMAVEQGVNAILYDLKPAPFSVQAGCDTRRLHPNEYRWPQAGYDNNQYPLDEERAVCPPLLKWVGDQASFVAAQWRNSFRRWVRWHTNARRRKGSVRWEPEIERNFSQRELRQHVRQALDDGDCQMAVLCVGANETCQIKGSEHRSFRFWENDPYGFHQYDSDSSLPGGLRTLISGDGDGALQDFLRIACQRKKARSPIYALQILEPLLPALRKCAAYQSMMKRLNDAHPHHANRPDPAWLWEYYFFLFYGVHVDLHAAEVIRLLDKIIDPALLDGNKTLHLNLKDQVFGACFTLNAFLVRLFAWRIEQRAKTKVFHPGAMMVKVQSQENSHQCRSDPGSLGCLLKPHVVTFQTAASQPDSPPEVYHVIVIRHGIVSRTT